MRNVPVNPRDQDATSAKEVFLTLNKHKSVVINVINVKTFRIRLSEYAKTETRPDKKKKFTTEANGNLVTVFRIK